MERTGKPRDSGAVNRFGQCVCNDPNAGTIQLIVNIGLRAEYQLATEVQMTRCLDSDLIRLCVPVGKRKTMEANEN